MNNVFGEKLSKRIATCKILVIGAGGIGCEMLKNLALSGFRNVETIDLDTIDVSNLNRQFLFRKEHVGMSKANVAKEAVLKFNPDVNIVAHHGNVKRDKFNLKYFKIRKLPQVFRVCRANKSYKNITKFPTLQVLTNSIIKMQKIFKIS